MRAGSTFSISTSASRVEVLGTTIRVARAIAARFSSSPFERELIARGSASRIMSCTVISTGTGQFPRAVSA